MCIYTIAMLSIYWWRCSLPLRPHFHTQQTCTHLFERKRLRDEWMRGISLFFLLTEDTISIGLVIVHSPPPRSLSHASSPECILSDFHTRVQQQHIFHCFEFTIFHASSTCYRIHTDWNRKFYVHKIHTESQTKLKHTDRVRNRMRKKNTHTHRQH